MAFFGVTKASTQTRRRRPRGVCPLGDMDGASEEDDEEDNND